MHPGVSAVIFEPSLIERSPVAGAEAFTAWLSAHGVPWSVAANGDYGKAAALLRVDARRCLVFVSSRDAFLSARAAGGHVVRVLNGMPGHDDDVGEIDTFEAMLPRR